MCLQIVYSKPPAKSGYMFKVFKVSKSGNLHTGLMESPVSRGFWIQSRGARICSDHVDLKTDTFKTYPAGFHGMTTLRGAKKFFKEFWPYERGYYDGLVILKVRYSGGHTAGRQYGNCVVASKIYIPKNAKDLRKRCNNGWR